MGGSWPTEWPNTGMADVLHIFDLNDDVLLQLVCVIPLDLLNASEHNEFQDLDLAPGEEPVAQADTSLFESGHDEEPLDIQPDASIRLYSFRRVGQHIFAQKQ